MANNTINWGAIYASTDFGRTSENGFGIVYQDGGFPSPTPFTEIIAENGAYLLTENNNNIIKE